MGNNSKSRLPHLSVKRPKGQWDGNTQIMHTGSRIIKMIIVLLMIEAELKQLNFKLKLN